MLCLVPTEYSEGQVSVLIQADESPGIFQLNVLNPKGASIYTTAVHIEYKSRIQILPLLAAVVDGGWLIQLWTGVWIVVPEWDVLVVSGAC